MGRRRLGCLSCSRARLSDVWGGVTMPGGVISGVTVACLCTLSV